MYTIRVSVENRVSNQDERRERNTRSCEIIGSTGDSSKFLHSSFNLVFVEQCSIYWFTLLN